MSPGELVTAAIWQELRRIAHLISELAAANLDVSTRVTRLEVMHNLTEDEHAHGDRSPAVRADPPAPDERGRGVPD